MEPELTQEGRMMRGDEAQAVSVLSLLRHRVSSQDVTAQAEEGVHTATGVG